jgi:hypothetical protein
MTLRIAAFATSAILVALALVAVAHRDSPTTAATAPPFNPGATVCFEQSETVSQCDGASGVGAVADLRITFCLAWGPSCAVQPNIAVVQDSLYSLAVLFTPSGFVPPSAASAQVGALAGQLSSNQVFGVLNGPCHVAFQASFTLLRASTNLNDSIEPHPVGQVNPFEPLAIDVSPSNGIPDGVDKYPAFLQTLFDNQQPIGRFMGISKFLGTWTPVNLVFFSPGATVTMAGRTVTFNPSLGAPAIVVIQNPVAPDSPGPTSDYCAPQRNTLTLLGTSQDNPCTPQLVGPALLKGNCPLSSTGGANNSAQFGGYPFFPCEASNALDDDLDGTINDGCPQVNSVAEVGVQCTNEVSDDLEDSAVNDGCPAHEDGELVRSGNCSGTDEAECVLLTNPAPPSAQKFTIWTESYGDADGDGIENPLDVCSLDQDGEWNPRVADTVNDTDQDGLPNICDPDPNAKGGQSPLTCVAGIVGDDQDQDCVSNRQDNCPLVNQLMDPAAQPDQTNVPNQVDADWDGIGDACDPDPEAANGDLISICLAALLQVGQPAAEVVATQDPNPGPGCATGVVGPTPTPGPPVWGDVDCSGAVNSVDALKLLRHNAGLPYSKPLECPTPGSPYP